MILKQDTKILRNVPGEIVKQPLIIDIDSSYGVTKDGSNLVSSVKNRGNANQFLALSGDEPIENDDGFEFDNTKWLQGVNYNYLKNHIIEAWVKINTVDTYNNIISLWDNNNNNNGFILRQSNDAPFTAIFRHNGTYYINNVTNLGGSIPALVLNQWTHLLVYIQIEPDATTGQTSISIYQDGQCSRGSYEITPPVFTEKAECPAVVSGIYNTAIYGLRGNIRTLKVAYKNSVYLQNNTTTNSGKYAAGVQVFTPPTFPNTIL